MEEIPLSGATVEVAVTCMGAILWSGDAFGKRKSQLAVISNWHNSHLVIPNHRHGLKTTEYFVRVAELGSFTRAAIALKRGAARAQPPGAPA
jgi:hypothetical protein